MGMPINAVRRNCECCAVRLCSPSTRRLKPVPTPAHPPLPAYSTLQPGHTVFDQIVLQIRQRGGGFGHFCRGTAPSVGTTAERDEVVVGPYLSRVEVSFKSGAFAG